MVCRAYSPLAIRYGDAAQCTYHNDLEQTASKEFHTRSSCSYSQTPNG